MIQNPFIITGVIEDPYFCDRKEETKRLNQLVTSGANVLLSAPRRIGKSQLIDHCFRQVEIANNYYTIYIDLFHTTGVGSFTKAFGTAVFDAVLTWSDKIKMTIIATLKSLRPQMKIDELTGRMTWGLDWNHIANPDMSIKEIFEALEQADKPCIVAFDEFQQIAEYPEKNLEALLRGYIQKSRNCHFIYSGSKRHLLSQIFTNHNRPFFESTEPMSLQPIALDKYEEFSQYWMGQFNKTIEDGVIAYIYQRGEGNTAFLQRTMHHAFNRIEQGGVCTMQVVQKAINDMLDAADEIYKEKLGGLSDRQQDVLMAIAKEGKATKIMSGGFVNKYNLNSSSTVQSAVKKLLEDSWLTESQGIYSVSDTIFRLWLERMMQ